MTAGGKLPWANLEGGPRGHPGPRVRKCWVPDLGVGIAMLLRGVLMLQECFLKPWRVESPEVGAGAPGPARPFIGCVW